MTQGRIENSHQSNNIPISNHPYGANVFSTPPYRHSVSNNPVKATMEHTRLIPPAAGYENDIFLHVVA